MIPSTTEKFDKVTITTELAATEVMNIVDNFINRLEIMSSCLNKLEEKSEKILISIFSRRSLL